MTRCVTVILLAVVVQSTGFAGESRMLTVTIQDSATKEPVPALIRVTDSEGRPLVLNGLFKRQNGWFSIASGTAVELPRQPLTLEGVRGIESLIARESITANQMDVKIQIVRFANLREEGWQAGNTHLHLNRLSRTEAENYLRLVPDSDGLDLVYLSHLRRIPDESSYVSNAIVEDDWSGRALEKLSTNRVLLRPGEEHRHNFGRGGEGFGHVMLLEIPRMIRPVSIGPGIMRSGSDSQPVRKGMKEAIEAGGTVVWCHNTFGFEDIPNWLAGTIHAQNIFDGGSRGTYDESFYRYLNLGLHVPFSTGTDWFIDDFSRVYVPGTGSVVSKKWLSQLRQGRSMITNGPLLRFHANGRPAGHVFASDGSLQITVAASGAGRDDFGALQLIWNGAVYATAKTTRDHQGVFQAELKETLTVEEPGWLAVRAQPMSGNNAFGKPLFAHMSPVYMEINGKRVFKPETAIELITAMEEGLQAVREKAVFATSDEDESVVRVYRDGIKRLRAMLKEHEAR